MVDLRGGPEGPCPPLLAQVRLCINSIVGSKNRRVIIFECVIKLIFYLVTVVNYYYAPKLNPGSEQGYNRVITALLSLLFTNLLHCDL